MKKENPLVFLDGLIASTSENEEFYKDTLKWKADLFEASTLVWAEALPMEEKSIQEIFPGVTINEVSVLLLLSDFEAYWNRRGVGLSKSDIKQKWENGERIIQSETHLADMLRRSKGGT